MGRPMRRPWRAWACNPEGIAHLLDVLVSVQVLTRQDGRYAVTPSAATFLVSGRPADAGDLILAWTGPAIWESLGHAVRTGEPASFEEYHEQDAWLESYSEWRIGQITDYLTPTQNRDLFRRVHAALKPGGPLVLDVPMTSEQSSEWTAMVSLLLWANGGGGAHEFDEYRAWLEQAGFAQVRQLSERWLAAARPA